MSGAHLPGSSTCGGRGVVGISVSGLQRAVLCCSLRPGPDGWDAGGDAGSSGSGAEHPAPQSAGASTEEPPSPRVSASSLRTLHSLDLCPSFFCFCFCFLSQTVEPKIANPRNHQKPTLMQTHEGLFTSLSLCPCIPDTVEQGLGPRGGF